MGLRQSASRDYLGECGRSEGTEAIKNGGQCALSAFASQTPAAQFVVRDANDGGAAYVTRTRDPIITNDVLYQLS